MTEKRNKAQPLDLTPLMIHVRITEISNNYYGSSTGEGSFHRIVFQIEDELTDELAASVLFTLFIMSFVDAGINGLSDAKTDFNEQWDLRYFMDQLELNQENGTLSFSSDTMLGRSIKTDIVYELGGKVTLVTKNRGRNADKWLKMLAMESIQR